MNPGSDPSPEMARPPIDIDGAVDIDPETVAGTVIDIDIVFGTV